VLDGAGNGDRDVQVLEEDVHCNVLVNVYGN
jgi:hypothetical protein